MEDSMTRDEIISQISKHRSTKHCCIKAWGEDPKLVDYETIDRFIDRLAENPGYAGFVLLDLEQFWEVLTDLDPDKLSRVKEGNSEFIEWLWTDATGREKTNRYPFTAEGIMSIMNEEFFS
jgi:hypothetical protein